MKEINSSINQLKELSVIIGKNKKFIQASGGNTSFKSGNKIWVKASGKQLKNAFNEDIFVCLENINSSENLIDTDLKDIIFKSVGINSLKESIESFLHAVMPHKYVIHSHALDVIRESVIIDNFGSLSLNMSEYNCEFVNYKEPGMKLAKEVFANIKDKDIDVVILLNHGLIVGAESAKEVVYKHNKIVEKFYRKSRKIPKLDNDKLNQIISKLKDKTGMFWRLPKSNLIHTLGTDNWSFTIAKKLPLYPDHIVFCGQQALCLADDDFTKIDKETMINQKYIIVKDIGVFLNERSTFATEEMLEGQAYINLSIPIGVKIKTLTKSQCLDISELDSEKYRINMIKNTKK